MTRRAAIGHRTWVFPSGGIPVESTGPEPEFTSRDELCVLNADAESVTIEIEVMFEHDEPIGPFALRIGGRSVRHVRVNNLIDPRPVPLGVPYGLVVRSGHPVVAQLVRTDTRRGALAVTAMDGHGVG